MTDDLIDIYDADLRPIGTMDRKKAHHAGHWHRTFHCWLVRGGSEPSVMFQLRAPRMRNFPNLLDVSAAGHLDAGEQPEQGIREMEEELGLVVPIADAVHLGERVEVADQTNGQKNREYQSVYLLRWDGVASDLRLDPDEVWGIYWLPITPGLDLFAGAPSFCEHSGYRA